MYPQGGRHAGGDAVGIQVGRGLISAAKEIRIVRVVLEQPVEVEAGGEPSMVGLRFSRLREMRMPCVGRHGLANPILLLRRGAASLLLGLLQEGVHVRPELAHASCSSGGSMTQLGGLARRPGCNPPASGASAAAPPVASPAWPRPAASTADKGQPGATPAPAGASRRAADHPGPRHPHPGRSRPARRTWRLRSGRRPASRRPAPGRRRRPRGRSVPRRRRGAAPGTRPPGPNARRRRPAAARP